MKLELSVEARTVAGSEETLSNPMNRIASSDYNAIEVEPDALLIYCSSRHP
jgi:hypothetical protein